MKEEWNENILMLKYLAILSRKNNQQLKKTLGKATNITLIPPLDVKKGARSFPSGTDIHRR
jgi:hypothetical protein